MAINAKDFISKLPRKERVAIAKRGAELLAEEATLQEIRKAQRRSQAKVAKTLQINQAAVSKIERRTDMYVSTLRSYIEAMGGKLEIIAQFPGSPPVHISQFRELE
ncbi:MAG: XRE family transcriptional regulator [Alphaproteobacteria bacterium]